MLVVVIGYAATRWALDHLLCGEELEDLVDAPFDWRGLVLLTSCALNFGRPLRNPHWAESLGALVPSSSVAWLLVGRQAEGASLRAARRPR
jgi:hypothetical protein